MVTKPAFEVDTWIDIIAESKNKKTLIASAELLDILEKRTYRHGKSSVSFLVEKIPQTLISFSFLPFDPFFEEFNQKIRWLIEAGFFKLFSSSYQKNKMYNEEVPPLVLTVDDLSIGFEVCFVPMVLGIVVFLLEFGIARIKYLAKYFRDASVAVCVVMALSEILF